MSAGTNRASGDAHGVGRTCGYTDLQVSLTIPQGYAHEVLVQLYVVLVYACARVDQTSRRRTEQVYVQVQPDRIGVTEHDRHVAMSYSVDGTRHATPPPQPGDTRRGVGPAHAR